MTDIAPQPQSGGGMSRKIGPLPLWGWIAVLVIMVVAYIYMKKKAASNNTSASAGQSAVYNAQGQEIGTLSVDSQNTPVQVADQQHDGRQAQWNANNTPNGQTAASAPAADSLSGNTSDGATPAVSTTTPDTAPASPS